MRWLVLALIGAAVCTTGDHLHATHDVLWYPHVVFWSQAWWVPLLFGAASIAAVAGATPVRRLFGARLEPEPSGRQLAGDGLAFIAAYVVTSFLPADRPWVTMGLLTAWWLSRVVRDRSAWLIAFSLVTAVAGTSFEAGWSALGFFYYRHPDVAGVPLWLPGIYLHAALIAGPLERVLRGADRP